MPAPLSIAVYFTTWWIVLFAVLPFGVKTQHEAGGADLPPGADPGAPVAPMLARKAMWTTLLAGVIFVVVDAIYFWAA
jgi:predicted secreted protein